MSIRFLFRLPIVAVALLMLQANAEAQCHHASAPVHVHEAVQHQAASASHQYPAQQHTTSSIATAATPSKADIVDTAVGAGKFTTLVAAVKAAGLVETLKGKGPFTVFAPTDEAFGKIPVETINALLKPEAKDKLTSILTYHVVSGKVMAKDVVKLTSAATVNGQEVAIKVVDGKVMIDGATVTATDIECGNGVIHVIDSVIMPK